LLNFFDQLLDTLNRDDSQAQVVIIAVYSLLVVAIILLRVISHMHFWGQLTIVKQEIHREMKSKDDIKKVIRGYLLRIVVADYLKMAERSITSVPTRQIVNRAISSMSFFGWRYDNILPFIEAMENGFIFLGLILAIIFENSFFAYGLIAIIAFVLTRVSMAFFNARAARDMLSNEINIFIEREVGRFYPSDTGGAITRFKNDLTVVFEKQTTAYKEIMKDTMKDINTSMATTVDKVTGEMGKTTYDMTRNMLTAINALGPAIAKSIDDKLSGLDKELLSVGSSLKDTMKEWEVALIRAVNYQTSISATSESLEQTFTRFHSSSELLNTYMQGHSKSLSNHLLELVKTVESVKASLDAFGTQQETFAEQAKFIEKNQQILEESIQSYETTLQNLVQTMGSGLGAFFDLHAQTSVQTMNDALKANIDKLTNALVLQNQNQYKGTEDESL